MQTRTFKLDKLVRDGIVESTESQGGQVEYEVLEGQELIDALVKKLQEEFEELQNGEEPDLEKLADLAEILDSIAVAKGHKKVEFDAVQYDKRRKIGSFTSGHFVYTVTLPSDNQWAEYYAQYPERFPEITEDEQ